MEQGTESKITKIIGELNKASKTHKGQADRLSTEENKRALKEHLDGKKKQRKGV